ncbi:MAG TPA: hypothetical protein VE735_07140, partial [Gammaproteobacteria bacterium]|nr:hypothetical protein [Gammaproteobacteria bacterium]
RPFQASGSRGFYFWASHSSLPPRGPDRLAVRIEQLTAGRLALPKIRSLVGCTARPDPESQEACQFGDVHCLARYDPIMVFEHARSLLARLSNHA